MTNVTFTSWTHDSIQELFLESNTALGICLYLASLMYCIIWGYVKPVSSIFANCPLGVPLTEDWIEIICPFGQMLPSTRVVLYWPILDEAVCTESLSIQITFCQEICQRASMIISHPIPYDIEVVWKKKDWRNCWQCNFRSLKFCI